jgi:hypothetical protein
MNQGSNGLQIGEFMVSPSSGSDPSGQFAFSRITRSLSIPNGYKATISYQLRIVFQNTGLTLLPSGSFQTGNADISEDFDLVSGWNSLSGYYRQVCPSLCVVDAWGASYTPAWGNLMEPCNKDLSAMTFYLSPDNAQFDVNNVDGYGQSNIDLAYTSDGLMQQVALSDISFPPTAHGVNPGNPPSNPATWYQNPTLGTPANDVPSLVASNTRLTNIRLGSALNGLVTPLLSNYFNAPVMSPATFNYQSEEDSTVQPISYASPGILNFKKGIANYGQQAVFSSTVFALPAINPTGRAKKRTCRTTFAPISSLGYNTRFGSLVAAYNTDDTQTPPKLITFPIIDCLFFDTAGRSTMQHYRQISGIYLTNRGTGVADAYFTIQPTGDTNIQRFLTCKTMQGAISSNGTIVDNGFFSLNGGLNSGYWLDGVNTPTTGNSTFGAAYGCSGWGAVIGVVGPTNGADYTGLPYDLGLADHNVSMYGGGLMVTAFNPDPNPLINGSAPIMGAPSNSSNLYWPAPVQSNILTLSVTNVSYYSSQSCFSPNTTPLTGIPGVVGQPGYNWIGNPCHFCPPTGYISHYDGIGGTGYRLLPNCGYPNNDISDTYLPTTGGQYPALSRDNGLDLYLDIMWTAPCGGSATKNCIDVPLVASNITY